MSTVMRAAARMLVWIAAILGTGLGVVALAGQVVSPVVYRLLWLLYEDPVAPVILGYGVVDVVAPALSLGLAVLVLLGVALVFKLRLGHSLAAIVGGSTIVLGWTVAVEGMNVPLASAAMGGIAGGATFLLAQRVAGLRETDLGSA